MRVKSTKLRQSAQGQECTLRLYCCNGDPETTVLAHIGRDSGMGIKASDNMAVFACSSCHAEIDGSAKDAWALEKLQALEKTQQHWIDNELMVVK
jgi:hypothetical protein